MASIILVMHTGIHAIGLNIASSDKIIDRQGYDSLAELLELIEKMCAELVTLIRQTEGTIPNPKSGQPDIPNPGIKVSHWSLTNLKTAAFVARQLIHMSRPLDLPSIYLATSSITHFSGLKQAENAYTNPPNNTSLEQD